MDTHAEEVAKGQRFEFGENWSRFLAVLDEGRVLEAMRSLRQMLGVEGLAGRTFLDVGSGSGLFSLAARRMGAQVRSFDYDPKSVACTAELRRRYFPDDTFWLVERGSVLDEHYLNTLGKFDIVYSWGVLHHTGAMWKALDNVEKLVGKEGFLFISLYNDQQQKSKIWHAVKRIYCSGFAGRALVVSIYFPYFFLGGLFKDLIGQRNPIKRYTEYRKQRGMSALRDWIDWLGGYPFEVSKPEQIFEFYQQRGFTLCKLKTCGGKMGCNEYVLVRNKM